MSPFIQMAQAALRLVAGLLPEAWGNSVLMVASLLGLLKLPAGDPKQSRVAEIVVALIADVKEGLELTDNNAQLTARLMAENRALRALAELSGGAI